MEKRKSKDRSSSCEISVAFPFSFLFSFFLMIFNISVVHLLFCLLSLKTLLVIDRVQMDSFFSFFFVLLFLKPFVTSDNCSRSWPSVIDIQSPLAPRKFRNLNTGRFADSPRTIYVTIRCIFSSSLPSFFPLSASIITNTIGKLALMICVTLKIFNGKMGGSRL